MRVFIFCTIILCNSIASCFGQSTSEYYRTEITDKVLTVTIRQYVSENNIDLTKRVITLKVVTGLKKVVTITDELGDFYKTNFTPTYYGVLDKKIVFFVFAKVDDLFKIDKKQIISEIDQVLRLHGVSLLKDAMTLYCAPVWRITEDCSGGYELNKKVTPFEFESTPCGYRLLRDSARLDSLKLVKGNF